MTNATLTPSEDPNLVRWTPADGPLAEALADLPDGHPITIEGPGVHLEGVNVRTVREQGFGWKLGDMTRYIWGDDFTGVTSASWLLPGPAWDGALIIEAIRREGDERKVLLYLNENGYYASGVEYVGTPPRRLDKEFKDIVVIMDADCSYPGYSDRHVGADYA